MSAEEVELWLLENPGIVGYICFLLVGSLISFIILIRQISKAKRLEKHSVSPWPIANTDFALFIVCLLLWFVLSGALLISLFDWFSEPETHPGAGVAVFGGVLLQSGMLYLFLRFRFHFRSANEGPLSPKILSIGQSLFTGLFYFLASLPIVYGVGMLWGVVLEILRQRGFNIDLPLQDAVLIFQETENPLTFFGLILLAVVIAPIVEETVFRGGVYRFFKGKTSIVLSLFISGLLFGLIHGNLQSLPGLIAVGVCLGLAYELSGSIRVSIFFHAFFNLNSIVWILLIPKPLLDKLSQEGDLNEVNMGILEKLRQGIITETPEETEALGVEIAKALPENVALALSGDLGAGKTTLVRGVARGLGIVATVTSPTYTIYTTYVGDRQLLHMDAYRLADAHELDSLCIDEFLKPPYLIAVEWPENIPGFFEDYKTYQISLDLLPDHTHVIRLK